MEKKQEEFLIITLCCKFLSRTHTHFLCCNYRYFLLSGYCTSNNHWSEM